jgi:hypothetical protein
VIRLAIAVLVLAVTLPASVVVRHHTETHTTPPRWTGSGAPNSGYWETGTTSTKEPSWDHPVALGLMVGGIGVASLLGVSWLVALTMQPTPRRTAP